MTIKATANGPFLAVEAIDVLSVDDLPGLFTAFEKAAAAGPFVVLTDTTLMKSSPRHVISAFSDGIKKMPALSKNWLGNAVVVNSPAVRFVLSTLLIVAPMPTDVKVFDDRMEARRWCGSILGREGLTIPPQLLKAG
jgi:hypothetical protein